MLRTNNLIPRCTVLLQSCPLSHPTDLQQFLDLKILQLDGIAALLPYSERAKAQLKRVSSRVILLLE